MYLNLHGWKFTLWCWTNNTAAAAAAASLKNHSDSSASNKRADNIIPRFWDSQVLRQPFWQTRLDTQRNVAQTILSAEKINLLMQSVNMVSL